ncbi:hypothetical protein KFK09_004199 [Dendrobium nobile]|uniref:Uncharacterized protein n=1 Tax=Dendrobium nobile TaxID=94219 RepID=A0A8T3BZP3_DENNO|nr:hypothetical protein KFK09_004199 [Dendrobium nobile]
MPKVGFLLEDFGHFDFERLLKYLNNKKISYGLCTTPFRKAPIHLDLEISEQNNNTPTLYSVLDSFGRTRCITFVRSLSLSLINFKGYQNRYLSSV